MWNCGVWCFLFVFVLFPLVGGSSVPPVTTLVVLVISMIKAVLSQSDNPFPLCPPPSAKRPHPFACSDSWYLDSKLRMAGVLRPAL